MNGSTELGLETPACSACRDLWREYEMCRNGIKDYDDYLFRVRTWSTAVNAAFLGAILTLESEGVGALQYGVAAMLVAGIALCFWIQDAANKSLQYVYIRSSRKLELALHKGSEENLAMHPSISHRFITRNNNLNSRVLRRMWDTSVLIYHVPAIILSYIIISMSYYGNALSNKPNSTDNSENIIDEKLMTILSPEYTAILIGSLPLAIILFGFLLYLFLEECDEDKVFEQICADSNLFENCSNFDQRIDLIRAQCKTGQGSPIERFFVPYARATKGITPRAQNHMISDPPSSSAIASEEAAFALITAVQERAALSAALSDAGLPTDDLDNPAINIFALRKADEPIGFVGLEGTGTDRLLRSLVVLPGARGTGGGKQLVAALEGFARDDGCARLHLLTTTAEAFFAKLGYARADRASAPSSISGSAEFTSLCPASAAYMMKALS